jgi:hypothetical protein
MQYFSVELAKKQEKKSLGPFKARVLGLTWQHLWRIKHLEDAHGLKHDVDRSTKIVDRSKKIVDRVHC